jgi:hypothetical protein
MTMRRSVGPVLLAFAIGVMPTASAQQIPQPGTPTLVPPEGVAPEIAERGFTRAQIETMQARIATAQAIVNRLEPAAKAAGAAAGWRQASLESLLELSLPQLDAVQRQAHTLHSLARATATAIEDPSLLGDPSADLVYTPISPCRYIDTRNVGGKITPAAPRGFNLASTGATYGGSGVCAVTQGVVAALAMNVTVTDPSAAPGFLAVKPALAAPVTSFMNWYEAGPHVQLANAGVVTVSQAGAPDEFFIQVSYETHVIVDLFGVFQAPQATELQTTVETAGPFTVSPNTSSLGITPSCPLGYSVTGGSCHGNSQCLWLVTSAQFVPTKEWMCGYYNACAAAQTFVARVHCARIPGR